MSKPLGLGVKVFSASLGVFIPKCFHNKLFRGRGAGFALRTPAAATRRAPGRRHRGRVIHGPGPGGAAPAGGGAGVGAGVSRAGWAGRPRRRPRRSARPSQSVSRICDSFLLRKSPGSPE